MSYRTIVADPPWRYGSQRGAVARGHARKHYDTMPLEAIKGLPVESMADDNAHLYLWVTNPILFDAFPILAAWGFEYRTLLTWRKLGTLGMGYYFRGDTEHVIFAVRGKAPIAPHLRARNWFAAPKTGHSRKPDLFYEMVERVSPEPRLELFARRRRYGWDVWGNEAPTEQASQAEMGLAS